jgi:hypothetical protein
MVEVGTLNGSELAPSVGAVVAVTGVLDEEDGVSVKPAAPDCIADAGELSAGLSGWITWAWATSTAASHGIITKMNIRFIVLSPSCKSMEGICNKTLLDRSRSRLPHIPTAFARRSSAKPPGSAKCQ